MGSTRPQVSRKSRTRLPRYWNTLKEVNEVSARPPYYKESCKMLGVKPAKPILDRFRYDDEARAVRSIDDRTVELQLNP